MEFIDEVVLLIYFFSSRLEESTISLVVVGKGSTLVSGVLPELFECAVLSPHFICISLYTDT